MAEQQRIRKDDLSKGQVNKCPVDTCLVRGRIHILMNASGMDVDMRILFVVAGRKIASIVFNKHKE